MNADPITIEFKINASLLDVEVRKITETAIIPTYGSAGAAGMDLYADRFLVIYPGERRLVLTGIAIAMPDFLEAQVRPRSGLALQHGITIVNAPGTIDPDYRGEIGVVLLNTDKENIFPVKRGDRIAQIVFAPFYRATPKIVEKLSTATARGDKGYGSTGL